MNALLLNNPKGNLAVWYSAQSHLQFIQNCGEEITVIIPEKALEDIENTWIPLFKPDKVVTYKGYIDLWSKLRKLADRNHFCLSWKETILVWMMLLFTKRVIYYWFQGILPEEDFLRSKNSIRRAIFRFLEWISLRVSDKQILVSTYMKEYLEKTRKFRFRDFVIVPCTSNLEYVHDQRVKHSFIYIGGLSVWQRIDRILTMFATIIKKVPESRLYLITYETDKALKLVDKYIPEKYHQNVVCKTITDREKISKLLSSMEYGFLIRDDDPINNVSSPIKLAEYLSCGVNVIISKSVLSYTGTIEEEGCGIIIDADSDIEKIFKHTPEERAAIDVYNKIFNREVILDKYKNFITNN